jgi:hypothetical protein
MSVSDSNAHADELHMDVRLGGVTLLRGAQTAHELGLQRQLALSMSALLNGGPVVVEHWLPGLHLVCESAIQVREGNHLWSAQDGWSLLHVRLQAWLEGCGPNNALELSCEHGVCWAVSLPALPKRAEERAYTLRVLWTEPGVPPRVIETDAMLKVR